ncbi:MAG: hypothetical protein KAJ12_13105 [Bacteroidetes bacterium]|nr:hypothetical protein [Bacteroidota bacterium]
MRLVLLIVLAVAGCSTESQDPRSFEFRSARLLDVASLEQDTSFFSAAARIVVGRDTATAFGMLDSLTRDRVIGGMFYAYTLIGTYLHLRSELPDSLHDKVRNAYRVRTMYRGDTENHWVMYYTGLYLAAQTWPGETGDRWFNGKSSEENFVEAQEWLSHWMRITSTIGQGEFDSPTYMTVFISPMLVLYDFAEDPVMKRKAGMMLDLLLADFAAEHLKGAYGGGHSRDYPEDIINPLATPATMWAWLYFGEPEFEQWNEVRYRPRHRGSWETVLGALSSYRLPGVIRRIATDRTTPYVHREKKRVRNVIRFGDSLNPPVYKYSYVTKDFVLGSLQGGILQPIQQHTWDVTYVSDKPNNTLFSLHPFYSGRELAMFFPEEQKFLAEEVDRYHFVYTDPDKWNSSSPYEQTFQNKGTLVVLYNIAPEARHQHVDAFFPKNLDERSTDSTGWIVCRGGNTFIGLFPLKPYTWIEEEVNWRLRSEDPVNGLVVEVASAEGYSSLGEFATALSSGDLRVDTLQSPLTVRYSTLAGDVMEFTFDGSRILNGSPVEFWDSSLYDGPYVQSEFGSGVVRIQHGGDVRVLDFNNATVTER